MRKKQKKSYYVILPIYMYYYLQLYVIYVEKQYIYI